MEYSQIQVTMGVDNFTKRPFFFKILNALTYSLMTLKRKAAVFPVCLEETAVQRKLK